MKTFFSTLIKITISIALVFLVIKVTHLDLLKTIEQLKQTNIFWFIVSVLMFSGTIFTNAYRWMILANLLGYQLKFNRGLRLYFESSFSNNFFPTNFGGDALRAYDLANEHSRRQHLHNEKDTPNNWLRAASTVFTERMFGFVMLFALMPIGLLIGKFSQYSHAIPEKFEYLLWIGFVAMVVGFLSYKLWTMLPFSFIQKIKFAVKEYTVCKKSLLKVILWTFITHVFFIAGNIAAAFAMNIGIEAIPLWYWFLLIPASTLAGFVIPAVKGVGAKEASYIYILGLIGISSDISLAIAFLTFIATLISTLPGLSIVFRKVKVSKIIEKEHRLEEAEISHLGQR